jgi:folate-binding protein YgfZ
LSRPDLARPAIPAYVTEEGDASPFEECRIMDQGRIAELSRRAVVAVRGAEAEKFLNDLVTSDVTAISAGAAAYGGLLTPQGKILFDFIVFREEDGFLIDIPRAAVADFVKRLGFYRLRAKVEIAEDDRRVMAAWGSDRPPAVAGLVAADPRLPALGFRIIAEEAAAAPGFEPASEADYDAHRIALGVPEGGVDFAFGEAFPHDADMDQLAGVAFDKGCFVGQEVVSRMEHRGTARRRIVHVRAASPIPPAGAEITAGDRPVGTIASSADHAGLALVRLDRAREAIDTGVPLMARGMPVEVEIPEWARFKWPESAGQE